MWSRWEKIQKGRALRHGVKEGTRAKWYQDRVPVEGRHRREAGDKTPPTYLYFRGNRTANKEATTFMKAARDLGWSVEEVHLPPLGSPARLKVLSGKLKEVGHAVVGLDLEGVSVRFAPVSYTHLTLPTICSV